MLYLITVNYHSTDLIRRLLRSLEDNTTEWQCLIVNNSPDDRQIYMLENSSVQVLETGSNLGFGGGCNLGLRWVYERDETAIAWLLNPDTVVPPNTLQQAFKFCQTHAQLAIVGTVIREPDDTIWFAGGEFDPTNGKIVARETLPQFATDYLETQWVTGCSLLLNLQNFSSCPHFDPDFFLYYEDFDFCRRYAHLGLGITNQIQVIHTPSSITSRNLPLKVQHSTYSYLLALEKHTSPKVVLYRLGRILAHGLKVSLVEPEKAIAIIKGVLHYLVRVSHFAKFHHH